MGAERRAGGISRYNRKEVILLVPKIFEGYRQDTDNNRYSVYGGLFDRACGEAEAGHWVPMVGF